MAYLNLKFYFHYILFFIFFIFSLSFQILYFFQSFVHLNKLCILVSSKYHSSKLFCFTKWKEFNTTRITANLKNEFKEYIYIYITDKTKTGCFYSHLSCMHPTKHIKKKLIFAGLITNSMCL